MAPSTIRRAIGAVKDQTSIGIAKVSNSTAVSDLDVAIVKATRHDEYPADERHVREILSLTCYSRAYVSSCVATLSRRLGKTRSWTVALKTLIVIHRLVIEGDPAYEQEIFFATRQGTRMLNMSDFRDTSRPDAWDFSAFVRTYARYLDERLEFRMHGRRHSRKTGSSFTQREEEEEAAVSAAAASAKSARETPVRDMKTEGIFVRTQHLQQLMERFLACRPTGAARSNRIVAVALYPLVKESHQIYYDLQEIMNIFIDRFMEMEVRNCVRVHDIFSRLAKQFDELDAFYCWCKSVGISRHSDFPSVERITSSKLDLMDEFIRDRANLQQGPQQLYLEPAPLPAAEEQAQDRAEVEAEEVQLSFDMNAIKALPAPETSNAAVIRKAALKAQEEEEARKKKSSAAAEDADFLNLRNDAPTMEQHGDSLALALFDGGSAAAAPPAWEAFKDDSADWETALVQSASGLSGQQTTLGGGFDMLLLDGLYSQADQGVLAEKAKGVVGSASSVALPAPGPTMLALPAPPGAGVGVDPFAASLAVPPPAYVQMSEMERKQHHMTEEQVLWQQYQRDGMQGQLGMNRLNQYNYFIPQQLQQQQQMQYMGWYYNK